MFSRRGLFSRLLGGAAAAIVAKVAPKDPPLYDFSSCVTRPESIVPLSPGKSGADLRDFHGCDKTLADCIARGSNAPLFGGFDPCNGDLRWRDKDGGVLQVFDGKQWRSLDVPPEREPLVHGIVDVTVRVREFD